MTEDNIHLMGFPIVMGETYRGPHHNQSHMQLSVGLSSQEIPFHQERPSRVELSIGLPSPTTIFLSPSLSKYQPHDMPTSHPRIPLQQERPRRVELGIGLPSPTTNMLSSSISKNQLHDMPTAQSEGGGHVLYGIRVGTSVSWRQTQAHQRERGTRRGRNRNWGDRDGGTGG